MKKEKKSSHRATSVTPFLKLLAMALFIISPFVGFYLGMVYQHTTNRKGLQSGNATIPSKIESVDRLVITRPEDTIDNLSAIQQEINDSVKVLKLYDEIHSLPEVIKSGLPRSCPIEFFVKYYLDFYRGDRRISHAVLDPTGCPIVTLSNGVIKDALNEEGRMFINELQETLHYSNGEFYGYQNGRLLR
jgi:hypothetical protein